MPNDPQIKGLPEGVEVVDYFPTTADDYEVMSTPAGQYIAKGVRNGAAMAMKVRPALGYTFVPTGFEMTDIHTLIPGRPKFSVAKLLGTFSNDGSQFTPQSKAITVTAKFSVANELHEAQLEEAIGKVAEMPGYQEMQRS